MGNIRGDRERREMAELGGLVPGPNGVMRPSSDVPVRSRRDFYRLVVDAEMLIPEVLRVPRRIVARRRAGRAALRTDYDDGARPTIANGYKLGPVMGVEGDPTPADLR